MLELPVEEVLQGCLPAVLVHILPVFAASKMHRSEANVSVTQHDLANATSCYDSLVKILGKEVCRHCGGRSEFFLGGEVVRSNCHVPKFCVILLLQLPCLLLSWWPHSGVGVTESIIMKDRLCSSCYFWVRMCLLQDEIIIFYSVACTVRFVWVLCVCDMGQPDSFLPSSWLHFQLSMLLRSFQFHCETVFLSVLPDGFRGHHWCQGHRKCSIFDLYSTILHYCDLRLS